MVKRKVVSKNVPPDVSAAKLLMEIKECDNDLTAFSDEELESEKMRLIKIIMSEQTDEV